METFDVISLVDQLGNGLDRLRSDPYRTASTPCVVNARSLSEALLKEDGAAINNVCHYPLLVLFTHSYPSALTNSLSSLSRQHKRRRETLTCRSENRVDSTIVMHARVSFCLMVACSNPQLPRNTHTIHSVMRHVVLFLGLLATGCAAGRSPESADPARERGPGRAVGTRTGVRPRARR